MLTELIPLALVVALSPLSVIPAVLVLHTPRPRPTGLAFLAGWLVGLVVLTAIFLEVSSLAGGLREKPPGWASWLRIVIGRALIVFGVYRWFTRKKSAHTPKWIQGLSKLTPAACGRHRYRAHRRQPQGAVHLCRSGFGDRLRRARRCRAHVARRRVVRGGRRHPPWRYPFSAYAVSGDRLDEPLARLRDWLERQHATLVAVILVVIGLLVLYKGIHGLELG